MSEFRIGEIANAKVGRNIVNVEVIEDCGNGSYKVKSFATGREFYTHRLEHTNHPLNEELYMIDEETQHHRTRRRKQRSQPSTGIRETGKRKKTQSLRGGSGSP